MANKMIISTWEEMYVDCLIQVFAKVDTYGLLWFVPLVCKSWYKACRAGTYEWKVLDFQFVPESMVLSHVTKFMRLTVDRSDRLNVTRVTLPKWFEIEALDYILDQCPGLKSLALLSLPETCRRIWFCIFRQAQNLEVLELGFFPYHLDDMLRAIRLHGINFTSLSISSNHYITKRQASAIANLLPNIKHLKFRGCRIEPEDLLLILKSCRELVVFDVMDCTGFGCVDDEILKAASHIKRFLFSKHRAINTNKAVANYQLTPFPFTG
ncbi:hypothetical protein AQUCO_03400285v1 [Aquilegia coerulea]|uniref:F-box domain-containing protein n=1 Tax=Aquilegia coerulea TaxID=218851 RepID=A0A2G5CYC2_AQUCA|nr:hypothetical protein AQUCO_03400285v1 [Aquilegia coerulea]